MKPAIDLAALIRKKRRAKRNVFFSEESGGSGGIQHSLGGVTDSRSLAMDVTLDQPFFDSIGGGGSFGSSSGGSLFD